MRRVVTGHDDTGRSVVSSDDKGRRTTHLKGWPGFSTSLAWTTDLGDNNLQDRTTEATTFIPTAGGSRLILLTIPPDSVFNTDSFNPELSAREQLEASPGLAELFENDNPGMHTTPTVDYVIVCSGRIVLELDDGVTTELAAGDTVIQRATRHAWRNPYNEPAQLACVLLGLEGEKP